MPFSNIVLIGMPGVGKSTIGVLLAKALAYDFVDTDILLQQQEGRPLQGILQQEGLEGFLDLEARCILKSTFTHSVIATGGSVVYREEAMAHLRREGLCLYLELPLAELEHRLDNLRTRGVVRQPGEGLKDLYEHRSPLYERYQDLRISCSGKNQDALVAEIRQRLRDEVLPNRSG